MSLSDTCYKMLAEMSQTVLHYGKNEHYTGYLSGLVDAMFLLADVALRLSTFDPLYQQYAQLAVAKLVFTTFVPDDADEDRYPRRHVEMVLVEIACSNTQFARALLALEEWLVTTDAHHCLANVRPQYALVADILENARWSTAGLAA